VTASVRYLDPGLPAEERVQDLLERMTLPEKVGQMLQLDAQGDLADLVSTKVVGSQRSAWQPGPGWASPC